MKQIISKRIEVTYEATKIYRVVERCDPRRYGALVSYSEEKTIITKVYLLKWMDISWDRHLVIKYPDVYGFDRLRIIKCRIVEFVEEPMERHRRHGLVLGDPRYRGVDDEIIDF